MTDRQTLLVALAFIYAIECLFWVRRGGVVFRRVLGPRWWVATQSEFARNDRGDLHWASPFLSLGAVHVCREPALSFSRLGVLSFVPSAVHPAGRPLQGGRFLPWGEVREISTVGKVLFVNGEPLWQTDSVHAPPRVGRLLSELRKLAEADREARIQREIEHLFDEKAFQARRAELDACNGTLVTLCRGLFAFLFIGCPLVIALRGWFPALWFLLPALFAQTVAISALLARAHRRLFPDADEDRFRLAWICALAPASAVRAPDLLSRPLLEQFHPLLAGAVLMRGEDFEPFGRLAWRDMKFPRIPEAPADPPAATETARAFHGQLVASAEAFLRRKGYSPDPWLKAPTPTDPSHSRYCPRCEAQFTAAGSQCGECGGRPLVAL